MRTLELVLDLYPGIGLLARAFKAHGFAVVTGPDTLFGTRIEDFHVPAGRFDGIIGGPPCVNYSDANRNRDRDEGDRLMMEYLRLVDESRCEWFVLENVRNVPDVHVDGYRVQRLDAFGPDFGIKQTRLRHIQFGSRLGDMIRPARLSAGRPVTRIPTLTTAPAGAGDRYSRRCAKMGLPPLHLPAFTPAARRRMIGNGVPLPIGEALAVAVHARSNPHAADCVCGCGRPVSAQALQATPACRKRMQRRRQGHTRSITWGVITP